MNFSRINKTSAHGPSDDRCPPPRRERRAAGTPPHQSVIALVGLALLTGCIAESPRPRIAAENDPVDTEDAVPNAPPRRDARAGRGADAGPVHADATRIEFVRRDGAVWREPDATRPPTPDGAPLAWDTAIEPRPQPDIGDPDVGPTPDAGGRDASSPVDLDPDSTVSDSTVERSRDVLDLRGYRFDARQADIRGFDASESDADTPDAGGIPVAEDATRQANFDARVHDAHESDDATRDPSPDAAPATRHEWRLVAVTRSGRRDIVPEWRLDADDPDAAWSRHTSEFWWTMIPMAPGTFIVGVEPPRDDGVEDDAVAAWLDGDSEAIDAEQIHNVKRADAYEVTLTRPFAVAAVEATRREWQTLTGSAPVSAGPEQSGCFAEWCGLLNISWASALVLANSRSDAEGLPRCYANFDDCTGEARNGSLQCPDVDHLADGLESPLDCRGYRLPTEAEWEYAARSGGATGALFDTRERVTYCPAPRWRFRPVVFPVGSSPPNDWGFINTVHNGQEWTWDRWSWRPEGPVVDPEGPDAPPALEQMFPFERELPRHSQARVLRGGSTNTTCPFGTAYTREFGYGPELANTVRLAKTLFDGEYDLVEIRTQQ